MANHKRVVRPTTSSFRNADQLAGGLLVEILTECRGSGMSYGSIVSHLFAEHRVTVSQPTVASWLRDLGLLETEAASA